MQENSPRRFEFILEALRELNLCPAQQGFVDIANVLPAPVGVYNQARHGLLGQQGALQGTGDQGHVHIGPDVPAHDMFGAYVLKGAEVGPLAVGQGQVIMSLTHTRLAWVRREWSSSKFGAQRCPWVELVVRRAKALGCTARRPWRRSPVRKA